jgi:hypothetical protein
MPDQRSDDDQRRDALLLRLLKTLPNRAPTPQSARRTKRKPTRTRGKRGSTGKRERR